LQSGRQELGEIAQVAQLFGALEKSPAFGGNLSRNALSDIDRQLVSQGRMKPERCPHLEFPVLSQADQSAQAMVTGRQDIHQAMIAIEQANLSLRLMVQVRNKMVAAYEEIMRMQF
jgi:hypothetical protein